MLNYSILKDQFNLIKNFQELFSKYYSIMDKVNYDFINIAILGIGNIGTRHLESIIKTSLKINIFIFDIYENRSKEVYKHLYTFKKQYKY